MPEQQKTIKINGMTCVNCALNIERAVKKAGVKGVVNFSTKELIIEDFAGKKEAEIEKIVENSGFEVLKEGKKPIASSLKNTLFYIAVAIAIYFMAQMFFPMEWKNGCIDFALSTPALFIGLWKFGKGAWYSLKAGSANMYVLILLGAITAYIFSIYLLLVKGESMLYFETTAVIIALVMVGDWLEEKAIAKTTDSMQSLAKMQIQKAKKKVGDIFEEVSLNAVRKNDIVQVNEGDQIPTDGNVLEGEGLVDEALLTGESEPVFKTKETALYSGTTLVSGRFTYVVSKPGHQSALARVNDLVQKAGTEKANIQKLADKISAIFVPLIISISAVWFLVSYFALGITMEEAIIRSVAILVISCPCAMGLATPMAVMVGIGKLSDKGILVKGAQTIETFAKTKNIILDKTGTITTGQFQINNFKTYGVAENEAKAIIYSIESQSSHPIAQSVSKSLQAFQGFALENVVEIKGSGMQAQDKEGNIYQLGSANFTQNNSETADLFLMKNQELIASFGIKDELKPKVKETIDYLKSHSVEPIVLSGDSQKKCDLLKKELAIQIEGELKPEDKLQRIEKYTKDVTAMVGDGINDAPALSKAHIGISFSKASNVAIESANIVLLNHHFELLETAHKIAQMTLQTIKQNLFWAFAYNLVAIPLAAFGILNPMAAAFFMLFSDLMVIGNAYRLKLKEVKI